MHSVKISSKSEMVDVESFIHLIRNDWSGHPRRSFYYTKWL